MPIKSLFENAVFNWVLISSIVILMIITNGILALKTIEDLSSTQNSLYNTGDIIVELDDLHNLVLTNRNNRVFNALSRCFRSFMRTA